MMDEERKTKKDYGIGTSLKMLFRGVVEMLRLAMWLAPVAFVLLVLFGAYTLFADFDAAVRVLNWVGVKFI